MDRFKLQSFHLCFVQPLDLQSSTRGAMAAEWLKGVLQNRLAPYPVRFRVGVGNTNGLQLLTVALQLPTSTMLGSSLDHLLTFTMEVIRTTFAETASPSEVERIKKQVRQYQIYAERDARSVAIRQCLMIANKHLPSIPLYGIPEELEACARLNDWKDAMEQWGRSVPYLFAVSSRHGAGLLRQQELLMGTAILEGERPKPPLFYPNDEEVKWLELEGQEELGTLVIGYRWSRLPHAPAVAVLQNLLAGGGHSLLFDRLREREQLVYDVQCHTDRTQGILLVMGKVKLANMKRAEELVQEELQSIQRGEIPEVAYQAAWESLRLQQALMLDDPLRASRSALYRFLDGEDPNVTTFHATDVSLQQLQQCAQGLELKAIVRVGERGR